MIIWKYKVSKFTFYNNHTSKLYLILIENKPGAIRWISDEILSDLLSKNLIKIKALKKYNRLESSYIKLVESK